MSIDVESSEIDFRKLKILEVKDIVAYLSKCECGFNNCSKLFYKICPNCGKSLYAFTMRDLK